MHRRNKTMQARTRHSQFSIQHYNTCEDPEAYLMEVLQNQAKERGLNCESINIKQFENLLQALPLVLKLKQLHELYFFASPTLNLSKKQVEARAKSIGSLSRNKINLASVAKWIHLKVAKHKIKMVGLDRPRFSIYGQSDQSRMSPRSAEKYALPKIKTKPSQIFKTELSNVLDIFSKMEKQRQDAGLEPVAIGQDQTEVHNQLPTRQIHYEGEFFEVNSRLNKLKSEAYQRIQSIMEAARHDKKLNNKFEEALLKYQRVRTEANEKIGRCGAMKAQKRMIEKRRQEMRALDKWRQQSNQTEIKTMQY